MKNVLKIVFLGIIGFGALVYLTAPKMENQSKLDGQNIESNLKYFPRFFDVISSDKSINRENIFSNKNDLHIVVLNHDCLAVFNQLDKITDKNIVLVANVSNTPWLIKQLAVNDKLLELYNSSKIPLIIDDKGMFIKVLGLNDITQNSYFLYKVNQNNDIVKYSDGKVKLDALEKGISEEEIKKDLDLFLTKL